MGFFGIFWDFLGFFNFFWDFLDIGKISIGTMYPWTNCYTLGSGNAATSGLGYKQLTKNSPVMLGEHFSIHIEIISDDHFRLIKGGSTML